MVRFRYLISLKRREKLPSCLKNVQIHETFGIGMINYDIQVTFRNLSIMLVPGNHLTFMLTF